MKKFLLIALGLLLATNLMASNMGFKLNFPLTNTGTVGVNWVSLPYFWGTAANAETVCADNTNITYVGHVIAGSETEEFRNCVTHTGTNFNITPGEAIYVKVSAANNWIIVGSHNDLASVSLTNTGVVGINWISVPYHTTATNAEGICSQNINITYVGHVIAGSETEEFRNCVTHTGTNFNLTAGEGIYVKVGTSTTWTPAHY